MAANPLTLAALATAAVPGIELAGAVADGSDAEVEAVAARTSDGRTVRIVVARTPAALQRMRTHAAALVAFTDAVRARLPFEVPRTLGTAPVQQTEVAVTTRLPGTALRLGDLTPGHVDLAEAVGEAIAAIHELPTSVAAEASLPHRSVAELRRELVDVFDRAATTGRVPAALLQRWESALDDAALWQFQPRLVHGDLQAPAIRSADSTVVGIDGWHAFSVGDPAVDLAWLLASEHRATVDAAFAAYVGVRGTDRQLRKRAMVHAELDVARWLLHGVDQRDAEVVADAEGMLDRLSARVADEDASTALDAERLGTMDLTGVQQLLDERGAPVPAGSLASDAQATEEVGARPTGEAETDVVPALRADAQDEPSHR